MTTMMSPTPPALVLVAHGSSQHRDALDPVLTLAQQVRARGRFASVAVMFMKGEPQARPMAEVVGGQPAIVVPIFMGRGYFTDTLVPKALALSVAPQVVYTPPLGCHPGIPALLLKRAIKAAQTGGVDLGTSFLYLVAHGSARPGGSGETSYQILEAIRRISPFKGVELGFLEQEPKAEFWRDSLPESDVIILPLLVDSGAHATEDLPRIFGFGSEDGSGNQNAIVMELGRRLVMVSTLEIEPDLVDLVIELATCHYEEANKRYNV